MIILRLPLDTYAFSVEFGPLHAIVTGRFFDRHQEIEREAMLSHEEGHIRCHHTTRRLLWILYRWTDTNAWMKSVREQEFEADAYAVLQGHADGLLSFLSKFTRQSHFSPLHPTPRERILAILRLMEAA